MLGLFTGGCGYTVGGNLPPHVKTVAVPIFKNLTGGMNGYAQEVDPATPVY